MENLVQLPAKWQNWSVVELIGQGTYGKVYKAECEDGTYAAIKVINIRIDRKNPGAAGKMEDEESIRNYYFDMVMNFSFEIRLMEQLKDCPHVVQIYDSKITEDRDGGGWTIYIMMEYLHDISRLMASFGELDEKKIAEFGMQICDALEVCEEKKIVHRDIKPENIMVSDDGIYKLGDFGVAKLLEGTVDFGSIQGTYSYMAPEITRLQKYGNRADIYSLGMVLYHLLNRNRDPFLDPTKRLITYKEKEMAVERRLKGDPLPAPVDASPELAEIILKACEFEPEDRYAHISELKKDLDLLRKGRYRLKKTKNGRSRKVVLSKKQLKISVAAALLVMVLAVFAGAWGYTHVLYILPPITSESGSYTYSLKKNGVLEIRSLKDSCSMEECSYGNAPWSTMSDKIKTIKLIGSFSTIFGFEECNVEKVEGLENVTGIGDRTFFNCTNLESIEGLENVTDIGVQAFSGCSHLEQIKGLKNVEVIDVWAFSECPKLERIEGLEHVTEIQVGAFENCKNLRTIDLPNLSKIKISGDAFDNTPIIEEGIDDQGLWIVDHTLLRYTGTENDLEVPEDVTAIAARAFSECSTLVNIQGFGNVQSIGESAFSGCENLESISNMKNVRTIGDQAFSECSKLEHIGSLDQVTAIGFESFSYCTNLKKIEGLKNLKTIETGAFGNCDNLESVKGMKTVTKIEGEAFRDCKKLTYVELPDFNKITTLDGNAFDGTLFLNNKTDDQGFWIDDHTLIRYSGSKTEVNLPDQVTTIGRNAFYGCGKVERADGLENVTVIEANAFDSCENLKSVTGLKNVRTVGAEAFYNCGRLQSIDLPDIEKIDVFYGNALDDTPFLKSKTDDQGFWIEGHTLVRYSGDEINVEIPDEVTAIGAYAFYECSALESINGLEQVTAIGAEAFYDCMALKNINGLEHVTSVGEYAFEFCWLLDEKQVRAQLPKDCKISESAFKEEEE